jgi:hypothetical protein
MDEDDAEKRIPSWKVSRPSHLPNGGGPGNGSCWSYSFARRCRSITSGPVCTTSTGIALALPIGDEPWDADAI